MYQNGFPGFTILIHLHVSNKKIGALQVTLIKRICLFSKCNHGGNCSKGFFIKIQFAGYYAVVLIKGL